MLRVDDDIGAHGRAPLLANLIPFVSFQRVAMCLPHRGAGVSFSGHRPENETEHILVDRMAQHHWLRSRAQAFESGCFREDGTLDDKRLALFMRYRTSHERAFSKCLAELLKLRAEKRKAEIGFESQKAADPFGLAPESPAPAPKPPAAEAQPTKASSEPPSEANVEACLTYLEQKWGVSSAFDGSENRRVGL